jgi:hypothetical protein
MSRKSRTQVLTESILGQQLALAVAAHLARSQLVSDPLAIYDAQHLGEMLDLIAAALARVAPLYVQDPGSGTPRQLADSELEGAAVKRGGGMVVLRDGRTLSSVSIKRVDLRQAIAILKAVGIPGLQPPRPVEEARARTDKRVEAPLETLAEIERLLRLPLIPGQLERANRLAVSIARDAPHGRVANLAMQLMSVVHEASRSKNTDQARVDLAVAGLRAALSEAEKAKG